MKSEAFERLGRFLLSLICFTAYLFLFAAVIANTTNTSLHDFVLG